MSYLTHFYTMHELQRVANAGRYLTPTVSIDPRELLDQPRGKGGFGANVERKLINIYSLDHAAAKLCLGVED